MPESEPANGGSEAVLFSGRMHVVGRLPSDAVNFRNRPTLDERGCPLLDAELYCDGRYENTPRFGSIQFCDAKARAFRRFVQVSPLPSHFCRFALLDAILSGYDMKVAHSRSSTQFS